ncbi:MAG: hypothetical protein M1819_007251 [Sarea resinae]|nr:MAG: hypothetical protein M1819_007251 [Sarea resinae]
MSALLNHTLNSNMSTPFKTRIHCHLSTCAVKLSLYDYRPSIAINLLFIVLFSLTGFIHLSQLMFWPKRFFSCAIGVGCVVEVIGYIGRIMSNHNPFSISNYFIQFIGLTVAPAFFSASIYVCLGEITNSLGPQFSRLKPETYSKIFVCSDLGSLVLQGTGGLIALFLLLSGKSGQPGIDLMLVGLGYQILSLIVFIFLALEFAWKLSQWNKARGETIFIPGRSEARLQIFLVFFCLSIFCLFARCIYRCAELSGGLEGPMLHDETMFIFLEGMLITICVFSLNLGHPGMLPAPTVLSLEEDCEKGLPDLKVTLAPERDGNGTPYQDPAEYVICEDPSVHHKRHSGLRDLLSPVCPKRLSFLSPTNPLTSHPNTLQVDSSAVKDRRLSPANSLNDIYNMYGPGGEFAGHEPARYGEKRPSNNPYYVPSSPTSNNPYGNYSAKDGQQVQVIYIREDSNGRHLERVQELPEYLPGR